jgi:hypothetical protein
MIILVKLLVGDLVFNVISAYAPQIGLNESIKSIVFKAIRRRTPFLPFKR